jgi:hypothetical protein
MENADGYHLSLTYTHEAIKAKVTCAVSVGQLAESVTV